MNKIVENQKLNKDHDKFARKKTADKALNAVNQFEESLKELNDLLQKKEHRKST